jgi:hypothetical protein
MSSYFFTFYNSSELRSWMPLRMAGMTRDTPVFWAIATLSRFVSDVVPFAAPFQIPNAAIWIDFLENLRPALPAFAKSTVRFPVALEYLCADRGFVFAPNNVMGMGFAFAFD